MKHIRKLFHFIIPYRVQAIVSLVLLTLLVFLDLAIPRLIQQIIDQGIKQNNLQVVINTSVIMVIITLVSTVLAIGNSNFSIYVGESVARDLREAIFLKIQSFSYGNLDRFTTGKLMVRLSSDTSAIQRLTQVSLRIGTRAPLLMIGSVILMINTSPHLAMTLMPVLFITFAVIILFSVKMEPLFRTVQLKLDRLNTILQENIAGARLVKAFVRADHENDRFKSANDELSERTVKVMQFMSAMSPVLTVFVNVGMVILIWSGGLQAMKGEITMGQLVAFTNYLLTTMTPLVMMTNLSNVWANGLASAQRVNEILDTEPEVQDLPAALPLPANDSTQVAFQQVGFHYNGDADRQVLEDINLLVKPNQTIAILGATGAGKSSLINLIPRFYDTTDGHITLNGFDIRAVSQNSLRARIGIVPQETVLFSGTIRNNICYGRPDATDDEVIAAAKAAQAHDFILQLPQGYDTHVEERGMNLSGGQKQRIAIARAIITRPQILILDDSTSSVDVDTEVQIQAALTEVMRGRICFIVAQRISTVLNADQIIVIDKGRIAAQGTHRELMQSSRIYQEIYESQLGDGVHLANAALPE
jgi:ATP-binding cassette subfamily B protein